MQVARLWSDKDDPMFRTSSNVRSKETALRKGGEEAAGSRVEVNAGRASSCIAPASPSCLENRNTEGQPRQVRIKARPRHVGQVGLRC